MEQKYYIINWSINDIDAGLFLCDLLKEQNSKFVISFTSDEKVMDVKRVTKDEFLNYNHG
jgi:hypothetical protein